MRPAHFRIFALSWVSYVGFYLCRKNLSVILPVLMRDQAYTTGQLAHLILCFSAAYCVGQFLMGPLADKFGPRRVVTAGMLVSAVGTAAMGLSSHYGTLVLCQVVNGVAQSAGWAGLMKMMKHSKTRKRGVVMGWWTTNYVVGGLLGTLLATYSLGFSWLPGASWRKASFLPAAALLLLGLIFHIATRDYIHFPDPVDVSKPASSLAIYRSVLASGRIRMLAITYFLVKMIRYSLLFWLPLYFTSYLKMAPSHAGYIAARFEIYGMAGVLGMAYLSDYIFHAKRFPPAMLMMILLIFSCYAASHLTVASSISHVLLLVALLGCATYGTDTILVGAATQDAVGEERIGTVAGIVDGAGSIGQLLSPLLIAFVSERFGWPSVFLYLAAVAALCGVLLAWSIPLERHPTLA